MLFGIICSLQVKSRLDSDGHYKNRQEETRLKLKFSKIRTI